MRTTHFLVAVVGTAILVPCAGSAIQMSYIGMRNGHGLGLVAALASSVTVLPLAILVAPLNAVGTTLLGALSLGFERLIRGGSKLIWLFHGLAVGGLNLFAFHRYHLSELVVIGVLGSWLLGSFAMCAMLSGKAADDDSESLRSYSSSSSSS